jgi:hypothetical protein
MEGKQPVGKPCYRRIDLGEPRHQALINIVMHEKPSKCRTALATPSSAKALCGAPSRDRMPSASSRTKAGWTEAASIIVLASETSMWNVRPRLGVKLAKTIM